MLYREEYGNIGAASPNPSLYGTRCDGTRLVSYDSSRSGRGRIEGEFYLPCSFKERGQWDLSSLTPLVRFSAFVAVILYRTSAALLFIVLKLPTLENPS